MVVIAIFAILSAIMIFNYGKFNSSLSIKNLADDIALTVRRAQGFAIGVRGYSTDFSQGYGIHFTSNTGSDIYAGSNKAFILFADMASNNKYDYPSSKTCGNPTTSNECIEALSIKSNDGVRAIYYNEKSEGKKINSSGTLDILFRRPNPEPIFCIRNNPASTNCDTLGSIISMIIEISSLSNPDIYKTVTISNNGQISVSD